MASEIPDADADADADSESFRERIRARRAEDDRGQVGLGRFSGLVLGAVALGVLVIVLFFMMEIAGSMAVSMNDEDFTVTNESITIDTGQATNVSKRPSDEFIVSLNDDETIVNSSTEPNEELVEGTHYEFHPDNGSVTWFAGSSVVNDGDTALITYSGVEKSDAHQNVISPSQTAFGLFGTATIVVPAVVVIALLLGAFAGFGMSRNRRRGGGGR